MLQDKKKPCFQILETFKKFFVNARPETVKKFVVVYLPFIKNFPAPPRSRATTRPHPCCFKAAREGSGFDASPEEPPIDLGEKNVEEELQGIHAEAGHEEGHAHQHVDGRQLAHAQ